MSNTDTKTAEPQVADLAQRLNEEMQKALSQSHGTNEDKTLHIKRKLSSITRTLTFDGEYWRTDDGYRFDDVDIVVNFVVGPSSVADSEEGA
jgi:hypothetical protein